MILARYPSRIVYPFVAPFKFTAPSHYYQLISMNYIYYFLVYYTFHSKCCGVSKLFRWMFNLHYLKNHTFKFTISVQKSDIRIWFHRGFSNILINKKVHVLHRHHNASSWLMKADNRCKCLFWWWWWWWWWWFIY